MTETVSQAASAYQNRIAQADAQIASLDRVSARLANLRTVAFLSSLVAGALSYFQKIETWGYGASILGLVLYILLAVWHHQIHRKENRAGLFRAINLRALDRFSEAWKDLPERGDTFIDLGHPYSSDLNLFGRASLFQQLDDTGSTAGEALLAGWLTSPGQIKELQQRQQQVQELSSQLDFRQEVRLELQLVHGELAPGKNNRVKSSSDGLTSWAERGPWYAPSRLILTASCTLPWVTGLLFLFAGAHRELRLVAWLTLGLQAVIVALTRRSIAAVYQALGSTESRFARYEAVFERVSQQMWTDPELRRLGQACHAHRPLRDLGKIVSWIEIRQSPLIHSVLQALLLWDVLWFWRLDVWRRRYGKEIQGWFEALAQIEALSALAGYAHDHPDYIFPLLKESGPSFSSTGISHPLLPNPVRNDAQLSGPGFGFVVTGSNMSGKSTFLRTIGINAALALAGAPVRAESCCMSRLQILTSMRLTDSLDKGISHFLAEVQRLKQIWDQVATPNDRVGLFLLDEILLGTNLIERQLASLAYVNLLLDAGACGMIATHDLALGDLERTSDGKVKNVHFQDDLTDGRMTFDFKLRPGIVKTTNALTLLRLAGLPLDVPSK